LQVDNNLVGTVPPEFGLLSQHLERLEIISEFDLTGVIPEQLIMDSKKLTELAFVATSMHGTLSTYLGELTDLRRLQIKFGFFTGSIPTEISFLSLLSELNLQKNLLEGPIPVLPPNLRILSLFFNFLTGTLPESLGSLPYPSTVIFKQNLLTGTIPESWLFSSDSIGLAVLDIGFNFLDGTIPSAIATTLVGFEKLHGPQ